MLAEHARTLKEISNTEFPDAKWRVQDVWPTSSSVLVIAQRKGGKTTLVSNLLASLMDGDPLFGLYPATPIDPGRTVVVADLELHPKQTKAWARGLSLSDPDRVIYLNLRGKVKELDLFTEEGRDDITSFLMSVNAQVLILDPLRPLVDTFGLNEWTDLTKIFEHLKEVTQDAGVGELMLIHHAGAAGFNAAATDIRGRGDSGLEGGVDVIIRTSGVKDRDARQFTAFGREVDTGTIVTYDKKSGLYIADGVTDNDMNDSHFSNLLVSTIRSMGTSSVPEIAAALSGSRDLTKGPGRKVLRWVNRLVEEGVLSKDEEKRVMVL